MPSMTVGDPTRVFDWLDETARRMDRAGLVRRIHPRSTDHSVVDLSSNDYVSLARDSRVTSAAAEAAETWGAGAMAARLVSGTIPIHVQLEEELAEFCGMAAAVVFSSGYMANLGALTALCRPRSFLVTDAFVHASLLDGCRLSGADTVTAAHSDPEAVSTLLAQRSRGRALVVTESVFSVDGDVAPMAELLNVCRSHGAPLIVDDAHGLGVIGAGGHGASAAAGLAGQPDVVVTGTLGKSLGSQGGFVTGPRRVIDHVINMARPFLFDTGLAPSSAAAALAALRVLGEEPWRATAARAVATKISAQLTANGLPASVPQAAVVSVRAPSAIDAVEWANACRAEGVVVGCFRPPSVPDRFSRLRLSVRAEVDDDAVSRAVEAITANSPW